MCGFFALKNMFIPDKTRPIIEKMADNEAFGTNNIDSSITNYTYIGKEDRDGKWIIQKMDESTANTNVITYATRLNNPTVTDYSTAWTNKTDLTYGLFSTAIK